MSNPPLAITHSAVIVIAQHSCMLFSKKKTQGRRLKERKKTQCDSIYTRQQEKNV